MSEAAIVTKGEALVRGLDQIREGLEMVSRLGGKKDLVVALTGSKQGAQRLRDVMRSNNVVYQMVIGMVRARNSRLSEETVQKVVGDFLDVLFNLSQPYQGAGGESTDEQGLPAGTAN